MQLELVNNGHHIILRIIEIRAIEVVLRRNEITVLAIPLIVLRRKILRRNEFSIEHSLRRTVLAVGDIDGLKHLVHKLPVCRVRRNFQTKEFCSLSKAIHTDSKILFLHIYEPSIVHVKHISLVEVLDNLVEGNLILVHTLSHLGESLSYVIIVEVFLVIEVGRRIKSLSLRK